MSTNREVIDSFRKKIQEVGGDSNYSNKFLYQSLMEQGKWLIKREIHSGRIYTNNSLFQTLGCIPVIESSTVDQCCPVKVNCKIYRTKDKLPEAWIDNNGPILRSVTSVDGTTEFIVIAPTTWQSKRKDPYQKMIDTKYAFPGDGYLWFPENNPRFVNVVGYYTEDISDKSACHEDKKDCVRFLDKQFTIPDWLHSEMFAKALQQILPSKQFQPDNQIDKNETRRN